MGKKLAIKCTQCVYAVNNNHCGLRGFKSDFNVNYCSAQNTDKLPNGFELQEDGYFSWVNKKPKYPTTYAECCIAMYGSVADTYGKCIIKTNNGYNGSLIQSFQRLIFYRDAYWKIAGKEMGLDKPWSSKYGCGKWGYWIGYDINANKIYCQDSRLLLNRLLVFPTKEMRDAFYENFKDLIEQCKELL